MDFGMRGLLILLNDGKVIILLLPSVSDGRVLLTSGIIALHGKADILTHSQLPLLTRPFL